MKRKPALPLLTEQTEIARALKASMKRSASPTAAARIVHAASEPQTPASNPSLHSTAETHGAEAQSGRSPGIMAGAGTDGHLQSPTLARAGQASREDVSQSYHQVSVVIPANPGKVRESLGLGISSGWAQRRDRVKSSGAREAAAKKLSYLEDASADMLNELERLIKEQHYQVCTSYLHF